MLVRSNAMVNSDVVELVDNHSLGDTTNPIYNGAFYCFTINNPGVVCQPYCDFAEVLAERVGASYVICSLERGENTGVRHLQGYMQLTKKCKLTALKNKIRIYGMWVCPTKGTAEQNVAYVSHTGVHANKGGDLLEGPWSCGEMRGSSGGSRSDLSELVDSLKNGATIKKMAQQHTGSMLKYCSNVLRMHAILNTKQRTWMTELYIYHGVPGSGKSHTAHEEGRKYLADAGLDEEVYDLPVPAKGKDLWFQGYEGQAVICIDDFYGTIDIDTFKRMVDKYPMKVNIKNGHAELLARRIYVTSNIGWKNWWPSELLGNVNNTDAIQRRITDNKEFVNKYVDVVRMNNNIINDRMLSPVNQGLSELYCTEDPDLSSLSQAPTQRLQPAEFDDYWANNFRNRGFDLRDDIELFRMEHNDNSNSSSSKDVAEEFLTQNN